MKDVHLGFKAFDIHELLCHFMAHQGGYYQQRGLRVGLIDTTFVPDGQLPPRTLHAACGAALLAWAKGAAFKVVLVNTDYPMFWLYGATAVTDIAALAGKRVASYPAVAPPAQFLAAATGAIDVQLLPVGTDAARLGLLKSGDVDAALISSALPPAVMADHGFGEPLLLGSVFRAPTTGLALDRALLDAEMELVNAMVGAHQQGLAAIHHDDVLLGEVLLEQFSLPAGAVPGTVKLVRDLFSADGRSDAAVNQRAMAAVVAHLGGADLPAEPLYDFSLLNPV